MRYCRRYLKVWGVSLHKGSELCISAYMYILIQASFQIKSHCSLEIGRALKLVFILRVPIFTHFCSGFQCGKSSYEGHFAIWWLYALLFMIYFMGIKQNRSGKLGHFKTIRTVLWLPFGIWHHEIWYTYTKWGTTFLSKVTSRKTVSCYLSCQVSYLEIKT